ncbi:two-component sensor histidine kinase [Actinoplanes sp. NBRC 14428]|uniref:histidine kinase n=1 Tax=Pseudosporangium ferrugineum TaxID=439699 RepID=A0A2T0SFU9_9ACTN|nr:ATP-binding protein [Pseudosporangium ferrugineum]PRY32285.1 signal transduction histidine kinase [Pseudosporangium ferrugineum]BCJ49462.1 two-component sensor histidine kinase [Actinoplanes sp. NBRC 14428]
MAWLRRLSLRARLLLVSVVVLAVGLAGGGVALVATMNFALLRTANTEALETARAVAALVNTDSLSDPVPAAPAVRVQVLNARGQVLSVSAGADRLVPILYARELSGLPDGEGMFIPGSRIGFDGRVRVVALAAGPADERVTVLVARPTDDLKQSVHLLRTTLLVTFPLLVALLALVAWRVVGAALRPVEALRAGAEEITGGARPGRLPVPDSGDEIHRLAVTLNDMLHRLDAARARQRAFVADAAHELRSPLTNMRTELEVAQRLPDTTDWPELAGDLLTDVQRLSRLVDDLLLLARADDATTRPARAPAEPVELGQLLAEVAGRYEVAYERPAVPLRVRGDRDALGRVVANLLDNAVRHARSAVRLEVVADGAYQRIAVVDDGPGIPAADRERVFDRFTRLDDARARDAGGSGLGLAIVRELVRRHHGTVTLRGAVPPPGLRAEVRLPAA